MTRRTIALILPTGLTLARLCAVPLVIWLVLTGRHAAAFWVFVAAGVSDALDGALARWLDARTTLGAWLDPIADKALLVSVYVALGHAGVLPVWLVILVVFRDAMMIGAVLLFHLMGQRVTVAPLLVGKLNTAAQIMLAGLMLAMSGFGMVQDALADAMIATVAATTALSAVAYLVIWGRRLAGLEAS